MDSDTLRLEKIVCPDDPIPFDLGILPTALTPFNEPLAVLVMGSLSHPRNTEMEARLIGAFQRNIETPVLLAVPFVNEDVIRCLDDLAEERRSEIYQTPNRSYLGTWHWLTVEEVKPELHAAALRHRQKQS